MTRFSLAADIQPTVDESAAEREGQELAQTFEQEIGGLEPGVDGGGGVGGLGGARGGGGGGGAAAAGAGGLLSRLGGGAAAGGLATVALGGAVAFGMLQGIQTLSKASPALQATTGILSDAMSLFFRPFGRFLSSILRPAALGLLNMAVKFNEIAEDDGLAVAIGKISQQALTSFAGALGNAVEDIVTGEGSAGDVALVAGTAIAASKLITGTVGISSLISGTVSVGSYIVGSLGISSLLTGASLTSLITGASLTSFISGVSATAVIGSVGAATLIGGVAATAVIGAAALTALVTPVSLDELLSQPDEQVGMDAEEQEEAGRRGPRGAGQGGPPDEVDEGTTDMGRTPVTATDERLLRRGGLTDVEREIIEANRQTKEEVRRVREALEEGGSDDISPAERARAFGELDPF
jgi:hypothetical protein